MKTTIKVEGMTCDHCTAHVKEALEEISGVKSAKVNLKDKSALVDHGENVTLDSLKGAITEAGYQAL
jgi:copper ion binding protein